MAIAGSNQVDQFDRVGHENTNARHYNGISTAGRTACSLSASNRLLTPLNVAIADTALTIWSAKRFYGSPPVEVTWHPVTSIPMADTEGNPDPSVCTPQWISTAGPTCGKAPPCDHVMRGV
jgi:hypothetical protein